MTEKSRRKSVLWNYFTSVTDSKALCLICKHELSYKTGATSNLRKHLVRKHKDKSLPGVNAGLPLIKPTHSLNNEIQWTLVTPITTTSMTTPVPSVPAITLTTNMIENTAQENLVGDEMAIEVIHNTEDINNMLMLLFIEDFQPLCIVSDKGFKSFINALNPSYKLPDLHTLSASLIPEMYKKSYNDMVSMVQDEAQTLCLTLNVWDSFDGDTYMEVTGHYINEDFKAKTIALDCTSLGVFSSKEHVINKLNHVMESWDISAKVLAIVSNKASKISDAENLDWNRISCFAGILDSIVEDALSTPLAEEILKKTTKFVYLLNESDAAKELVIKHQLQKGATNPKELVKESSKKWYLMYAMLQRLVEMQNDIQNSLQVYEEDVLVFSPTDWQGCKELCMVLKPFHEASKKMSEEGYLNASMVIVITRGLLSVWKKLEKKANLTVLSKVVIKTLSHSLNEKFSKIEFDPSLALCTFLDPRFKHHVFTKAAASENIVKHAVQLLSEIVENDALAIESESLKEDMTEDDEDENDFSIWEDVDTVISKTLPKGTSKSKAAAEVQRYMKDRVLERGQTETPIEWWCRYARQYPYLSTLYRKQCCIVATSLSCDSLYSKNERMLATRRKLLSESELKQLRFLNVNQNVPYANEYII